MKCWNKYKIYSTYTVVIQPGKIFFIVKATNLAAGLVCNRPTHSIQWSLLHCIILLFCMESLIWHSCCCYQINSSGVKFREFPLILSGQNVLTT